MRFEHPLWLLASALVAAGLGVVAIFRQTGRWPQPAILFANIRAVLGRPNSWRLICSEWQWILRVLALLLVIMALARPQKGRSDSVVTSEGIDIMMLVDTSSSMAGEDFGGDMTRLDHVTEVMREFAEARPADRIGLVSFGMSAYTRCPLTLDHALLDGFFEFVQTSWHRAYESLRKKQARQGRADESNLTPDEMDLMGTAIGDALVTAVGRLEKSDSKSKVIVLLTDGENTAGETKPLDGAAIAKEFGIKVYTVGAGSDGAAPVTVYDRLGRRRKQYMRANLDEVTLQAIADETGGIFFHANTRDRLEEVYDEINRLERGEIKTKDYREWDELFAPFALAALVLIVLDRLLAATWLRRLP
ncbi:MAG: VWA domain-containing protein [Planctomycetota bacterium]